MITGADSAGNVQPIPRSSLCLKGPPTGKPYLARGRSGSRRLFWSCAGDCVKTTHLARWRETPQPAGVARRAGPASAVAPVALAGVQRSGRSSDTRRFGRAYPLQHIAQIHDGVVAVTLATSARTISLVRHRSEPFLSFNLRFPNGDGRGSITKVGAQRPSLQEAGHVSPPVGTNKGIRSRSKHCSRNCVGLITCLT